MINQHIIPHLWFDKEALEAIEFYKSVFPNVTILNTTTIHDTPSGDADITTFTLADYRFMALNGGPFFTMNPSISFFVTIDPAYDPQAEEHLDQLWEKLLPGAKILMPLDQYPFSKRYGWIQDRFGVSWQLILSDPLGEQRPMIVPSLMFVHEVCGKAEEARDFYLSVFNNSRAGVIARYPEAMEPNREGTAMYLDFMIENQWFAAMDSAFPHEFSFQESISLIISCDTQQEIDYYWEQLSAVPEAEQCGWLKDRYGVSWQVSPRILDEMMASGTQQQVDRVVKALLPMKKLDIQELVKAFTT